MQLINCGTNKLLVGNRTLIMGIVNVTPDSFSDGGDFYFYDQAIEHAKKLVEDGADIIDIGGESTRPFAKKVSVDEEMNRVIPVIQKLSKIISVPISIDTTKSSVAKAAINHGASIINDISALSFDAKMIEVAAQSGAGLILMHMRGTPKDMQLNLVYDNLLEEIKFFLNSSIKKAINCGVDKSSIIIDPGLGFGKTVYHNLKIIKYLNSFLDYEIPIMIGSSRKAFIQKILASNSNIDIKPKSIFTEIGTQATIAIAAMSGASVIRVHNVINTRATLDIVDALKKV